MMYEKGTFKIFHCPIQGNPKSPKTNTQQRESMTHIKTYILSLSLIVLNYGLFSNAFADSDTSPVIEKVSVSNPKSKQQNKQLVQGEYVRKRFLTVMKKPFGVTLEADKTGKDNAKLKTNLKRKILIIGDSHAQDFLNAIAENNLLNNSQIRTRYIPTRCQIYLGKKSNRKWIKEDQSLCERSDNLALAKDQIANADVIILAALWRQWAVQRLPQTLKNMKISSSQQLYVIGRRSFLNVDKQKIVGLNNKELRSTRNKVDEHQLEINKRMAEVLDENIFINTHNLVCGNGINCPVFTDRSKMISLDGGHLSKDGARYIGKILFEKSQLSKLVNN